jgi:hypothetical protein
VQRACICWRAANARLTSWKVFWWISRCNGVWVCTARWQIGWLYPLGRLHGVGGGLCVCGSQSVWRLRSISCMRCVAAPTGLPVAHGVGELRSTSKGFRGCACAVCMLRGSTSPAFQPLSTVLFKGLRWWRVGLFGCNQVVQLCHLITVMRSQCSSVSVFGSRSWQPAVGHIMVGLTVPHGDGAAVCAERPLTSYILLSLVALPVACAALRSCVVWGRQQSWSWPGAGELWHTHGLFCERSRQ